MGLRDIAKMLPLLALICFGLTLADEDRGPPWAGRVSRYPRPALLIRIPVAKLGLDLGRTESPLEVEVRGVVGVVMGPRRPFRASRARTAEIDLALKRCTLPYSAGCDVRDSGQSTECRGRRWQACSRCYVVVGAGELGMAA
jgi:hypothetical protein